MTTDATQPTPATPAAKPEQGAALPPTDNSIQENQAPAGMNKPEAATNPIANIFLGGKILGDQMGASSVQAGKPPSGSAGTETGEEKKKPEDKKEDEASRPTHTVRNLTAWRIGIEPPDDKDDSDIFILPPFGERSLEQEEYDRFAFEKWKNENLIEAVLNLPPTTYARDMALGCGVLLGGVYLLIGLAFFLVGVNPDVQTLYWFVGVLLVLFGGLVWLVTRQSVQARLTALQHWLEQAIRLLTIVVIVVGLPTLVVLFFGDNLGPLTVPQLQVPRAQPALLALVLQWALIIAASILPIIIYFLFDRQKLGALRENFYRQILRLDPQMETLDDARQTYRSKVEDIYGPESGNGVRTLLLGTNIPILAATLVITVGWIIALPPIVASTSKFALPDLYLGLVPQLSALNFGFMGAYVFSLNMLFRRYVRSDLSPKVYTHITIRVFVVAVTVWALSALLTFGGEALGVTGSVLGSIYDRGVQLVHPAPTVADNKAAETAVPATDVSGPLLLLLAFFVGFVPETGLTYIVKFLESQPILKNIALSVQDSHPLDRLDGINIYYQARLLEEGIENIQNLAHSDLIELMLDTRIPMSILIDWVDQAILYLHLAELQPKDQAAQAEGSLATLRKYGIRTATDLLKAYTAAQARKTETNTDEVEKFLAILDGEKPAPVHRLQVLIDALIDDEWLANIDYWQKSGAAANQMYTYQMIMDLRLARRSRTTTVTLTAMSGSAAGSTPG